MAEQIQLSAVTRYVRSLPGQYFLRREVARLLGVTPHAIRVVRHLDGLGPDLAARWGSKPLHLYSMDRVEALRRHFLRELPGTGSYGRPRTWTQVESEERNRKADLARYHRRRAADLLRAGDLAGAQAAVERAKALKDELDAQRAERLRNPLPRASLAERVEATVA